MAAMTGPDKKITPAAVRTGSGVTRAVNPSHPPYGASGPASVRGPVSVGPSSVSGRYAAIQGPPPSEAPRRASFTRQSQGPLRALVIAQDGDARRSIVRVAQKHGGETLLASSFGEAIYQLDSLENGWVMVFIDPLLAGFEPRIVNLLRQNPRVSRSPVVIVSAMNAQVLEDVMRSSGSDGFIVTSKGLLHMDTAVQAWLERHDAMMARY